MTISNVGDLATSFQLRRDTARLKTDLVRLTNELSSGVTSDVNSLLKGDFGPLAGIERGLERTNSFQTVISEFHILVSTQQSAIGKLRDLGTVSNTFLTLPDAADSTLIINAGAEALSRFQAAVSSLNVQVAGRSVFSGVDTNRPALADFDTILGAIETDIAVAGATTAADVDSVVSSWFGAGGGFETIGYIGGPATTVNTQLSDSEAAVPRITAENDAVREQLASLALGALLGRNVLSGDLEAQGDLARLAGERLNVADDGLVALQSSIGSVEAQIERARVEVASEADSLQFAKAEMIEVDPYDIAIKLQNTETRLQSIYAVTARLSRLSLVEFL